LAKQSAAGQRALNPKFETVNKDEVYIGNERSSKQGTEQGLRVMNQPLPQTCKTVPSKCGTITPT